MLMMNQPGTLQPPSVPSSIAARAEGREPTKEEIEAAVSAIAGDAKSIDVEVLSTKD